MLEGLEVGRGQCLAPSAHSVAGSQSVTCAVAERCAQDVEQPSPSSQRCWEGTEGL